MTTAARVPTVKALVNQLLDRDFTRATAPVIRAMTRPSPRLAQALAAFEAELSRLEATGERLSANNPALRVLLSDFADALRANAALLNSSTLDIQTASINAAQSLTRQLALPGVTPSMLDTIGVQWNTPDPAAVAKATEFTAKAAWGDALKTYQTELVDNARNIAIRGIVNGENPVTIARDLRTAIVDLPAYRAEQIMRTLQLTSYRSATAAYQAANADIIDHVVRIETLDDRTCVECWALHGDILEPGEVPEEHPNGRAVGVAVVKGFTRNVEPGPDIFDRLDDARKQAILGPAAFAAYQDGKVSLTDFVDHYTDPVYGEMIRAASLKGLLGDAAQQYYRSNANG